MGMNKDKIKLYTLEIVLIIILFFTLFVSNIFSRIGLAILLTVYTVIVSILLKRRKVLSIYQRQVLFLMIGFAIIYIVAFYLMGLYFGFYESIQKFGFGTFFLYILPLSFIIVSSELIRNIFISQKYKLAKFLAFAGMVLVDLVIYRNVYDISTLDGFLNIIGFTLFASISCNLLFNYISARYGYKPVMIYRLITVLYAYIIPIVPDMYVFFRSFLRMIYPYIIYLVIENNYSKRIFTSSYKSKKKGIVSFTVTTIVMVSLIMLISCQFRYGIIVIGSSSMTGAINKGDAVVFESFRGQKIAEGDVIVFEKDKTKIIHRVVKIKENNNKKLYYTKGDANLAIDEGFVVEDEIVGVSMFRVAYIGYPTLWVRDVFTNK